MICKSKIIADQGDAMDGSDERKMQTMKMIMDQNPFKWPLIRGEYFGWFKWWLAGIFKNKWKQNKSNIEEELFQ